MGNRNPADHLVFLGSAAHKTHVLSSVNDLVDDGCLRLQRAHGCGELSCLSRAVVNAVEIVADTLHAQLVFDVCVCG